MSFVKSLQCCYILVGLLIVHTVMHAQPASQQEQEVAFVQALIDVACDGEHESYEFELQQLLENRGKISASSIFQGLANTCASLGALINSNGKNKKENAVCNILGTVFAVAAEASAKSDKKKHSEDQDVRSLEELSRNIVMLAYALSDIVCDCSDQTLQAIRSDDRFLDALCKKVSLWYATQVRLKTSVSLGRGEKNCVRKKRPTSTTYKTGPVLSKRHACHRKG